MPQFTLHVRCCMSLLAFFSHISNLHMTLSLWLRHVQKYHLVPFHQHNKLINVVQWSPKLRESIPSNIVKIMLWQFCLAWIPRLFWIMLCFNSPQPGPGEPQHKFLWHPRIAMFSRIMLFFFFFFLSGWFCLFVFDGFADVSC